MQLIQELTLVQKAGVFIGIPLILLFVLIAARRRRAAGGVDAVAAPSESKRGRSKKGSGIPRRKRRKLAAEAAQAMGTPAPATQAAALLPVPVVEPVAVVEAAPASPAPEPVAAPPPPPVPLVPAPVDDPYVQEITFDDEQVAAFAEDTLPEVVVAAPGWPTPGELASSFDPDAFDPLPAADPTPPAPEPVEGVSDESMIDEEPEQPTGIIEMPVGYADAEYDEREITQWGGDFDPATGWGEDEVPVPVAVAAESEEWYDSERASGGGGSSVDQPNPVDLDQFWSDADTEEPWADSSEVEILSDIVEDGAVPDWVHDDEPAAWESASTDEAPAAQSAPDGWTIASPTHGSPVVLDLAGLAASGHALELVIESNGDGKGVRLRFESPLAGVETTPVVADPMEESLAGEPEGHVADLASRADTDDEHGFVFQAGVEAEAEVELPPAEMEVAADIVAEPLAQDFDVPFLTGGLPSAGVVEMRAPAAEAPFALPAHEPVAVEIHALPVEQAPAAQAIPDVELTEDPATILAEIRARLAALDGKN